MEPILSRKTILLVDDLPQNIDLLRNILSPGYRLKVALSGEKAISIAQSPSPPDIILLDVTMPDMDGYEVCEKLKASALTRKIPVIFVTAMTDIENEARGFEVGAVDYITKPVSPPIVLARVATHLALYDQNRVLEEKVRERTEELAHVRDVTIHGMAVLAETRDNETGNHIMRTKNYVQIMANYLMKRPRFRDKLDMESVELLLKSAPLHDIGKVGIVDDILLKPGSLTPDEWEQMKKHTILGRDAIIRAEEALGSDQNTSFLRIAREITISHHEKWDGSGYPHGLKGEEIPLAGRIMAMADVYDALISKRVYKAPMSHDQAVRIISEGDGRTTPDHFDPDLLMAFMELNQQFQHIAQAFKD